MPRLSRLSLAKPQIVAHFAKSGPAIYTEAELSGVLTSETNAWHLAKSTRLNDFIDFLKKYGDLKAYNFQADAYDRRITRYAWGPVSFHALALSMKGRGYLSHGTAANLHNLTKFNPKTIYLNVEQSPKPTPQGNLTQAALDQAFARKQRLSNYIFRHGSHSITIIAGKNTDQLGVETLKDSTGAALAVTNLERTLIDIVVRPAYAGGNNEILRMYRAARDRVSIDRLLCILNKLAYVYPYRQAIGFMMQVAGYKADEYVKLASRPPEFDFYLEHGLTQPAYSKAWRMYYPRSLKIPHGMSAN